MSAAKMGMVIRDPWYEFGTHSQFPAGPNTIFQDTMGGLLAEIGVRWVRLEFHIQGDDVAEQVARNDYFINEVAPRHGFKVLGLLNFNLLRGEPTHHLVTGHEQLDPLYGGGVNAYMRTWLNRARFIANRYQDNVHAYEILNEQNRMPDNSVIPAYLTARLHTKFYHFFHHRDRDTVPEGTSWRDTTPIILGGLHPKGTGEPGHDRYTSDLEYITQIYTHPWGGFPDYRRTTGRFPLDGLAYHPYPEEIRGSLNRVPRLRDAGWDTTMIAYRMDEVRQELRGLGDPDVPFWITEIGYNVAFRHQTEAGQVEFMAAVLPMLNQRPDVAVNFWFKYEDFLPATGPYANQWGVVRIPFEPDPSRPDGARYQEDGQPVMLRPSYHHYRTLVEQG